RDDGKVLAVGRVPDVEIDRNAWASTDERMRPGTRCPPRPSRARLEARRTACGSSMEVDLVGSSRVEGFVRALAIEPASPDRQFRDEGSSPERDEDQETRALRFERAHEPFDNRDAADLADSSEAVPDPATPTPAREALVRELRTLVGDQVPWRTS